MNKERVSSEPPRNEQETMNIAIGPEAAFDLAEKAWRKESFELNGREIEIRGIAHIPTTLELYRDKLEKEIGDAAVVVLEGAPDAEGELSDESIDALIREVRNSKRELSGLSREQMRSFLSRKPFHLFYEGVEKIVASKRKVLVKIDPSTKMIDVARSEKKEKEVQVIKALVSALGVIGLSGMEMVDSAKRMSDTRQGFNSSRSARNRGVTRRQVLKGMVGGAAALSMGSLSGELMAMMKADFGKDNMRKNNPLGSLFYNLIDYRNVGVAKGLDMLTKKKDIPPGKILVIYGFLHTSDLRYYAESPKERDAKYIAYAPYREVAPTKLKIYKHEDGAGWQTTEEEEIK